LLPLSVRVPCFVAVNRFVGLVEFEVGAGGVEEQQVHFQVQQIGDVVVDDARQLRLHLY